MEKSIYTREHEAFLRLLREAREGAGLTQVGLAEALGRSQSFVSKVERGETRLDVLHGAAEIIDVASLAAANVHPWYNQTLCRVNASVVRLGVVQGEYHWHKHDSEDEFFYVVSGRFLIDLEDRTVELAPGCGFVVPKGMSHRPRAPEKTVILMVEGAGIVPTGDA